MPPRCVPQRTWMRVPRPRSTRYSVPVPNCTMQAVAAAMDRSPQPSVSALLELWSNSRKAMPKTDHHVPRAFWRSFVVSLALLVLLILSGRAGELEAANQAYDQGKFAEAREGYEKLLENGSGSANL